MRPNHVQKASDANDALRLVVDFARTGRLGPLYCGMSLEQVEDLLGPPDDVQGRRRPHRRRPRYYLWGTDLQLLICDDTVVRISVPCWGSDRHPVGLPAPIGGWRRPPTSRLPMDDVIAALDAAGCSWREAPEMVVDRDGPGRAIRTLETGVVLVFGPDVDGDEPGAWLHAVMKDFPDAAPGSPSEGC
ncbi:hypothetical protein Arub01_22480 [Actinomadura rubrobrunea]|uniref:Uncharacterized protein n=2 Tax=Actinomadura rubrobrunea TaxID=115335 RepID=A0A9W6PT06_9ACTN|nr:hypothetical protein Arub01_22480 [Actinomadura rubrobrunea]